MFKKITEDAKLPTRATKFSAGVDVYANKDVTIDVGETAIVPLGIMIDLEKVKSASDRTLESKFGQTIDTIVGTLDGDEDLIYFEEFMSSHYIALKPRSSMRLKGLISHTGTIDLDYPDEIEVIIHNPVISANNTTVAVKGGTISITPNLNGCGEGVEGRYLIKKGDKIGQFLLMRHEGYLFGIESDEERTGGFGSTGA